MAYSWSWSWGSESTALLQSDMGFAFSSTSTAIIEPRTTEQYKPTGAPTKYSMAFDLAAWVKIPLLVVEGLDQGVISTAVKNTGGGSYNTNYPPIQVQSVASTDIEIRLTGAGGVTLYIDNVFKSTSALAYDFSDWRFLAVHFDFRANPWKARVTVDGVESNPEATDAAGATTAAFALFRSPAGADRSWYNGNIIVQDTYADVSTPRYVTRISPDADVSTVGTWTPTSGSNFASTGVDPLVTATNTTEATPTIGDEVITGYTGDLTSLLGGIPASVSLVTVHSYSTGAANTARAEVGDQAGATTTAGATELIGLGTTYAYASAPVAPGDSAAWEGTDTPKAKYEVVSV